MKEIESSEELTDEQRLTILAEALASAFISLEMRISGGSSEYPMEILNTVTQIGDSKLNAILSSALQEQASSEGLGYDGYKQEIASLLSGSGLSPKAAEAMEKQTLIEQIELYLQGDHRPEEKARNVVDELIRKGHWAQDEAGIRFQEIKDRVESQA